jgi:hypothetical protein
MMGYLGLEGEILAALTEADRCTAAAVAAQGCQFCGGPLHAANYRRKARGGLFVKLAGSLVRHSLCCGRRGCRRRVKPPSLRFLGRRVYLEIVLVLAGVWAQIATGLRAAARQTGVPARTLGRWLSWWQQEVPRLDWWAELRARFTPPPPVESTLPRSLWLHLCSHVASEDARVWLAARCLAPATTWLPDAARFVRDATGEMVTE